MFNIDGNVGAIVLAIVAQTLMIGYFAGTLRQIVKDHERRITKLEE